MSVSVNDVILPLSFAEDVFFEDLGDEGAIAFNAIAERQEACHLTLTASFMLKHLLSVKVRKRLWQMYKIHSPMWMPSK